MIQNKINKKSGNIFFTLFAAVGIVGALGLGSVTLLRGPVQTMVTLNQSQVTTDRADLSLRVMMADALATDANCDSDTKLEAAPWELPSGTETAPTGGGVFPSTYGANITDPWGRRFGYCVWDHGTLIDDAACGGAIQNRLQGAINDDTQPFITVISSGANQRFETTCADYVDISPADGTPDAPLLNKPKDSDDVVINYNTTEAQARMGDNWVFTNNDDATNDAATTQTNLEFGGDVNFSGTLDLARLGGGLVLPDFSGAVCNGATDGQMFRDSATTPPAIMVCDSGTFKSMSGGSGETPEYAYDFNPEAANCVLNNGGPFVEVATGTTAGFTDKVWGDGTYLYTANQTGGLSALSFNGLAFTEVDNLVTSTDARDVWGDGEYLYTADTAGDLIAFDFDGTTLTELDNDTTTGNARGVWGDGNFIYMANGTSGGLAAYSFNGTTLTALDTIVTGDTAFDVWGDGNYIYVANNTGLKAYTFDGTTLTEVGTTSTPTTAIRITGDSDYIYVASEMSGIFAFTFDGTAFTQTATIAPSGQLYDIWADGTYLYAARAGAGISAYEFDGAIFTEADSFNTAGDSRGIWGDGRYLYVADGSSGIRAYSGFECLSTSAGKIDRGDEAGTGIDYSYRAYGWGRSGDTLGNGTADTIREPRLILDNNEFYKISASETNTCGLKTDNSLWCWGSDIYGALGNGAILTANSNVPLPIMAGHKFIDVDLGRFHGCGKKLDNSLWCWGSDFFGKQGNGAISGDIHEPTKLTTISNVSDFSLSSSHACAITKDYQTYCWGRDDEGQLGTGTNISGGAGDQRTPVLLKIPEPFISIKAGVSTTCALAASGNAYCWGENTNGQVGMGTIGGIINTPTKVVGGHKFKQISVNNGGCGLTNKGVAYCWGNDNNNQANGDGTEVNTPTPLKVAVKEPFIEVPKQSNHVACGIISGGEAYCWGADSLGERGQGATAVTSQTLPTKVANIDNFVTLDCADNNCFGITKESRTAIDDPLSETIQNAQAIIQNTPSGNTTGSHGLSLNYASSTLGDKVGLAFKIDEQTIEGGDTIGASIQYELGTPNTLNFNLFDGSSINTQMILDENGALSLNSSGNLTSPKLSIHNGALAWNDARFDLGFLISEASGANQPAYFGLDAQTGAATILSGDDLLIQHTTLDGAAQTLIAEFDQTNLPKLFDTVFFEKDSAVIGANAYSDIATQTAMMKFLRYRGTEGSESAISANDVLGQINFRGYDGTDYDANGNKTILSKAGATATSGELIIRTEDGTTDGDINLKITENSVVEIGDTPALDNAKLAVAGRTSAQNAAKAGDDTICATTDDEGTIRLTDLGYEYCNGTSWETLYYSQPCKDDAYFTQISTSSSGTCGTLSNGESICWGDNSQLQTGTGITTNPQPDLIPIKSHKAIETHHSENWSAALLNDGRIKVWGDNTALGYMGIGANTNDQNLPIFVNSNHRYKKIATSRHNICAIRNDGIIDCWGDNASGQNGNGTTINNTTPTQVIGIKNATNIDIGDGFACALTANGLVWCWGENDHGQLGIGTETPFESVPHQVNITNVIDIAAGGNSAATTDGACAVKSDGTAWCWGDNAQGQIGNGTSGAANFTTPTQVSGITNAIEISRNRNTVIALLENGIVQEWGDTVAGSNTTPVTKTSLSNVTKLGVSSNGSTLCVILADNTAQCWGDQSFGQLGNGVVSGSATDTPATVINPYSCNNNKIVFTTSTEYEGNFGSVQAGNTICQAHADRANLPGRYLAWLSDSKGNSPAKNFNRLPNTHDYLRTDGAKISDGWASLLTGVSSRLDRLENGSGTGQTRAWTGTNTDGSSTGANCANWTSTAITATSGNTKTTGNWSAANTDSCSLSRPLVCVQQ